MSTINCALSVTACLLPPVGV